MANLKVEALDLHTLKSVLSSTSLTDSQKIDFIRSNEYGIKNIVSNELGANIFNQLMARRTMPLGRPLKNFLTRKADKVILARIIDLPTKHIDKHIDNVVNSLKSSEERNLETLNKIEKIKTYVYRHGSKDQVIKFFDYEISRAMDIGQKIHHTLEYDNGGLADYYRIPPHRMDDNTFIKLYNIVHDNLSISINNGKIRENEAEELANWTLGQVYLIQHNSKFINAVKNRINS